MYNNTFGALLDVAKHAVEKKAVVDAAALTGGGGGGADPMAAAMGGGGAAGGGDPVAAAMGGDPMAGGAAPPPSPGLSREEVQAMIQQAVGAGGGAGGMEPIKPKIDVNVEMLQIKKMLAKLLDASGIPIPASDMAVTSDDLTNMALQQQQAGGGAASMGGGGGGGGAQSAIQPPEAMGAASPSLAKGASTRKAEGHPYGEIGSDGFAQINDQASALLAVMAMRGQK